MKIPIELIKYEPKVIDNWKLEWLSRLMRRDGQLEPITVREQYSPGEDLPEYIILDGVYRYLVAVKLGWENIDTTVIRQKDYLRAQFLMGVA